MRDLRDVGWARGGGGRDPEAEEEAAGHEAGEIGAGCLDDGAEDDEGGAERHAHSSSYALLASFGRESEN